MARNKKVIAHDPRTLKILVVHEISYVEKVIYEIHEFPELLATRGHQVTFIDFAEGYKGKPGKNRRTWNQKGRVYPTAQVTIHSPWLSGLVSIDRLVALVTVWSVLWKLRKQDFDVVLNYAVPTYGLQVNLWARLRGIPVVHRALDVSHKIRESMWNPAIKLFEKIVFVMSTAISANNPSMSQYVSKTVAKKSDQVLVHFPPTFNRDWKPQAFDQKLATSLGLKPGEVIVGYLGSFFYFSGIPEVIQSLANMSNDQAQVKLLLIGGGEQEVELKQVVASLGLLDRVVFTGFIAFDEIPRYLSLFDVGINPMHVGDVSNYALPNKVIQYLALGLPVVSTGLSGLISSFDDCGDIVWAQSPSDVLGNAVPLALEKRAQGRISRKPSNCVSRFEKTESVLALENFLLTQSRR